MAVPQLPVEIYTEILAAIPTSKDEPSERTLLNCILANSLVQSAALAPAVWRVPYNARYTHCVPEREKQRREEVGDDWRELYVRRRRLDREALSLVDSIRRERIGRHQHARTLAREYSIDVWDALREESLLPVPSWYQDASSTGSVDVPEYALPRRYWARVMLGVIARQNVLREWGKLVTPRRDEVDFIRALSGLSAFCEVSPTEVSVLLEGVCTTCIDKLETTGLQLDPQEPDYNIWALCEAIRAAIHEQGFRLAIGAEFYRVLNQFPHHFLQPEHRATIPMSLVFVFVAVAHRLGINAFPANFPGVVQVHIQPPNEERPRLLDMRGTDPPTLIPDTPYVQFFPLTMADNGEFTRAASAATMLSRASNNLVMFMREERNQPGPPPHTYSHEAHESAHYAAACWLQLAEPIGGDGFVPPSCKPLDALAVLIDGLCPTLSPEQQGGMVLSCNAHVDAEDMDVVHSRRTNPNVKYFVGLVFRHRQYHYIGCIYGWDSRCQQSQFWIDEMGVNGLPHGRDQPFYHVLPSDGRLRYVAQDNIEPIAPHRATMLARAHSSFDRNFTDIETDETGSRGRLLLSEELKEAYPDDGAYGEAWVKNATLGAQLTYM